MRRLVIILALSVASARAQEPAAMSAPCMGSYFDAAGRVLRTLSGVPGAATADVEWRVPEPVLDAFVHSRLRVAIGKTKSDQIAAIVWRNGSPAATFLDTPIHSLAAVAFANESPKAAITDGSLVQVWSGLDDTPRLELEYRAGPAAGLVRMLAISGDEQLVTALLNSGEAVDLAVGSAPILQPTPVMALSYVRGTAREVLAIDGGGRLELRRDGATSILGTGFRGEPLLIGTHTHVVVAERETGRISWIDLESGAAGEAVCNCRPERVQTLDWDGLVYIGGPDSGGWLLDTNQASPALEPIYAVAAKDHR